jgi:trk system potassium uptake protein TrkA
MTALIEEAVSIGDLVRIFEFQQGRASMVEITLPEASPFAGQRVGDVDWPSETVLVAIIREERPLAPTPDDAMEVGDELLFITTTEQEVQLQKLVAPGARVRTGDDDEV